MEVGSPGTFIFVEAVVQRCSVKEVSSEISQNSQETTCIRVFNKVEGPFFIEHLRWLLLYLFNWYTGAARILIEPFKI